MSTPNRWAIRDAGSATFYNLTTGKPIVTLTTLKTSGVETSGETVYARGGTGNAKLVGFSSNREAKLTLEDAIFDNDALAMLTGNAISIAAKEIYYNESLTVASNAVTLTKTPADSGALLGLFAVNTDGTLGTEITYDASPATGEYSTSGKTVSLYAGDYADAATLKAYYKVDTATDAATITVSSSAFGGTFKVVLDCLVKDELTKVDYAAQLIVPNAKFEDNFNLSFAADGDPAVLTIPLEVLKNTTDTTMWQMVIYDSATIS